MKIEFTPGQLALQQEVREYMHGGIGYVNGELGLKSFCHVQHIVVHRFGSVKEQAWFPYTDKAKEGMKGFVRFFFTKPLGRWMSYWAAS